MSDRPQRPRRSVLYVPAVNARAVAKLPTLDALGISRLGQTVYHEDTPAIRGMIHKVEYMLEVDVVDIKEKG